MKHTKTILLILLLAATVCSCKNATPDDNGKTINKFGIQILIIDGCEYVIYVDNYNGGTAMVHHGNCHNPVHKLNIVK